MRVRKHGGSHKYIAKVRRCACACVALGLYACAGAATCAVLRCICDAHCCCSAEAADRAPEHSPIALRSFQVLYVGHECDLGVITVENDEFWKDVEPLELGNHIARAPIDRIDL